MTGGFPYNFFRACNNTKEKKVIEAFKKAWQNILFYFLDGYSYPF